MKKLFFVLTALFVVSAPAFCHPPNKIDVKVFGPRIDILVEHPTMNPNGHHIYEIVVKQNGKRIVEQLFSTQSGNVQRAMYLVPQVNPDDVFEVYAECNIGGDLTVKAKPQAKK